MNRLLLALPALASAPAAVAHPGHGAAWWHQHPETALVAIALVVAAYFAVRALARRRRDRASPAAPRSR